MRVSDNAYQLCTSIINCTTAGGAFLTTVFNFNNIYTPKRIRAENIILYLQLLLHCFHFHSCFLYLLFLHVHYLNFWSFSPFLVSYFHSIYFSYCSNLPFPVRSMFKNQARYYVQKDLIYILSLFCLNRRFWYLWSYYLYHHCRLRHHSNNLHLSCTSYVRSTAQCNSWFGCSLRLQLAIFNTDP